MSDPRHRFAWRTSARWLLALSILGAGASPHVHRLRHPSVYSDDVPRIFLVSTKTLWGSLTTPFNEHLAPAFDIVTWMAWRAAGERLSIVPTAFTMAAFVPFVLAIAVLGVFSRRVLGSWAAALLVVVAFAVAPIHVVETVWWYSGTNHMWALFWGLVALLGVVRGGPAGAMAVAIGSALSPACSLMGVLVAPACVMFSLSRRGAGWRLCAGAGIAGLGAYFVLGACFGLVQAMLYGRGRATQFWLGLGVAGEAPSLTLLPALFGIRDLDHVVPPVWALATTGGLGVSLLVWSWRSRDRAVILLGGFFILGAYLLIFPFRTADGQAIMLRTARYHLFPQLGLAMLLGVALRRPVQGVRGPEISLAVCLGLLAVHLPQQFAENSLYDYPNQAHTLSALERVRAICLAEGITDRQALTVLEPIQPRWMPFTIPGADTARLIGKIDSAKPVPDREVRGKLFAALSEKDREGLFGEMDAGRYFVASLALNADARLAIVARPVAAEHLEPTGPDNEFTAQGWPSDMEFTLDAPSEQIETARELVLPVNAPDGGVEVWWDDGHDRWTPGRSVHWTVESRPTGVVWALPLDRLPHWDGTQVRRIRVAFRYPGKIYVRPPFLTRASAPDDLEVIRAGQGNVE